MFDSQWTLIDHSCRKNVPFSQFFWSLQVQGLQESVEKSAMPTSVSGDGSKSNLLVCGCGLALQGANLTLNRVGYYRSTSYGEI